MEKPKKTVFSTKDLPSSSDLSPGAPVRLKRKIKGKSQRMKKAAPKRPSEQLPNTQEQKAVKPPSKNDTAVEQADPVFEKVLSFFHIKESFEYDKP